MFIMESIPIPQLDQRSTIYKIHKAWNQTERPWDERRKYINNGVALRLQVEHDEVCRVPPVLCGRKRACYKDEIYVLVDTTRYTQWRLKSIFGEQRNEMSLHF